jgi:prophage DNA circulation protein
MSDLWERQLVECSFGGLRLDVLTTEDEAGRVLVTHQIPHREGSPVRDMGAEPRTTRCKLIFFQVDADDDPRERFYFFKAKVDEGATQTFVHPISGRYRAKVGAMTWSAAAEPRDVISVECTFHEDADVPATFEAGGGSPTGAGLAEVEASAADLDASLVEVNDELGEDEEPLTSTVGADAVAKVGGWQDASVDLDDPLTLRRVNLELVAMSNAISRETDRLALATHPERWPIARSLSNLHHNLRRAAVVFTEESPKTFEITVRAPTNVYTLAARTYPGDDPERRAEQLMQLNDIPNPARLEPGTRLKAYTRKTSTRLRTPRLFGR